MEAPVASDEPARRRARRSVAGAAIVLAAPLAAGYREATAAA
jgi:hypothetical protein